MTWMLTNYVKKESFMSVNMFIDDMVCSCPYTIGTYYVNYTNVC